jgi:hypothetical protein
MEASVFTLFTLIMTCDQVSALINDFCAVSEVKHVTLFTNMPPSAPLKVCTIMSATSTIDKLKAARGAHAGGPQKRRTWSDRYDNLKETFGCDFGWQWYV